MIFDVNVIIWKTCCLQFIGVTKRRVNERSLLQENQVQGLNLYESNRAYSLAYNALRLYDFKYFDAIKISD